MNKPSFYLARNIGYEEPPDYKLYQGRPSKNIIGDRCIKYVSNCPDSFLLSDFCPNLWEKLNPDLILKPGECKKLNIYSATCERKQGTFIGFE